MVISRLEKFLTSLANANDRNIGREWKNRNGDTRRIVGKITLRDTKYYLVGTGYKDSDPSTDKNPELVKVDEIENIIKQEENAWASNKVFREAQKEKEAERLIKYKEATNLDGFENILTPAMRGKAISALTKSVSRNGKPVVIRDLIRNLVQQQWKIETLPKYGRVISNSDGHFLTERQLTKLGLDYAQYLINKFGQAF